MLWSAFLFLPGKKFSTLQQNIKKVSTRRQARASFLENESQYGVWRMADAMYTKKRLEDGVFHGVNAGYPKKS